MNSYIYNRNDFAMNRLLLLLFMFIGVCSYGQKVKITAMSKEYYRHKEVMGFTYLHEELTDEGFQWIANSKVEFDTIRPETLKRIYGKLNLKANKIGANAFRVIKSDIYAKGCKKYIEVGLYHLRMERRDENKRLFDGKRIYLFGFLGYHQNIEGYKIEVNGKKMLLQELRYKYFELNTGETFNISLGTGIKRDEISLKIESKMSPRYYKFNLYKGMLSKGQISEHEWSFGEFLARILKKEV